jgi:hypothetical protein
MLRPQASGQVLRAERLLHGTATGWVEAVLTTPDPAERLAPMNRYDYTRPSHTHTNRRGRTSLLSILAACWCLGSVGAHAGSVTYDGLQVDIQESFGSGTNQTMFVLDWKDGPTAFAWLYSWSDPSTTMDTALKQLAASEPTVFQYHSAFGGGFVTLLDYFDGSVEHTSDPNDILSIWDSAGTGDGPDFHLNLGVSAELMAGGWAGINAANIVDDYPGEPPRVPLASASVPEPSAIILLGAGMFLVGSYSRASRSRTGAASLSAKSPSPSSPCDGN